MPTPELTDPDPAPPTRPFRLYATPRQRPHAALTTTPTTDRVSALTPTSTKQIGDLTNGETGHRIAHPISLSVSSVQVSVPAAREDGRSGQRREKFRVALRFLLLPAPARLSLAAVTRRDATRSFPVRSAEVVACSVPRVDHHCSEEIMFRKKHGSHFNSNDAEQREAKIKELKATLGPLSRHSEKYCSQTCLTRYLEARNWNVTKSRKMLEESLKWRETYRPEDIRWPDVSVEAETGKMYKASFQDREGRTVVVMKPAKQNTTSHEGQIRFLVYVLENAILSLPEGQEKMVWLIDFTGWTMANATPVKTARESASILQNHYPERLAIAFLFNPPKVFEAFWKVIKIFLDPRSIEKVNFVYLKDEGSMKVMHKYIDPEVLPVEFGGKSSVVYNHEEYSELMMQDDIKTAGFWAADAKTDHVNRATNGTLVREGEVTPRSSLIAAKAS